MKSERQHLILNHFPYFLESEICSVMSNSLQPHGLYSPGKNTGVGSLSFLQWIFSTQGSNPGLLHCRQILYQLSHMGSPPSRCQLPYYPPMPGSSCLSTPMETQCPPPNPGLFLKCSYSYSLPIEYAHPSGAGP